MRRVAVAAAILIAAAVAIVGVLTFSGSQADTIDSVVAKGFNEDSNIPFERFKGKPLVVNFWASWCTFCIAEMPDFQTVYSGVNDRVEFLGVNVQDGTDISAEFKNKTGVTYPQVSDPDAAVFEGFGKGLGMPTTVFVDAQGRVLERFAGPLTESELRERIQKHFSVG